MSTTVTYKGSTIATVNNQTKTLNTQGQYLEADIILQDVTAGGATKMVTGTFSTGSSTGLARAVTIDYSGSGYPIMAMVVVDGGAYNSAVTTWYSTIQRYAVGQWTFSKSNMTTTPSYGTSGAANRGVTSWIYKSSTSSATTYSRSSAMNTNVLSSSDATEAGATCCRFTSKTKLSYYVASTSYGLMAGVTYRYYILYSI